MAAKNFTVQIVSATCPPSTRPDAQVMVPDNYKLLSGGAIVNDAGSNHGVLLTASFPESENIWRALGKDHIDADTKSITVFALALYDPDDIWEVRIFDNEGSEGPPTAHPSATVASNGDFKLIGGGARVNWTGNGNLLTASYPQDANTWAANSKDHRVSDPATITAYAVGIKVITS